MPAQQFLPMIVAPRFIRAKTPDRRGLTDRTMPFAATNQAQPPTPAKVRGRGVEARGRLSAAAPLPLPQEVTRLVDLVACLLRRAGLPADESRPILEGIDQLTRAPLNGALAEQEQALCRMALREAALRLTAWPNQQHSIDMIARAYAWMGGEQVLTGHPAD